VSFFLRTKLRSVRASRSTTLCTHWKEPLRLPEAGSSGQSVSDIDFAADNCAVGSLDASSRAKRIDHPQKVRLIFAGYSHTKVGIAGHNSNVHNPGNLRYNLLKVLSAIVRPEPHVNVGLQNIAQLRPVHQRIEAADDAGCL